MKFGTSQSVTRKEDVRLVSGHGRFIDDAAPERALHAVFYRSPMAHANISGLDVAAAAALPGVVAVYLAADFAGKMQNAVLSEVVRNRDGSKGAQPRRPVLAEDRVRHLGEAVAVVIAETRAAGHDALDLIACDFEELPAHVATAAGGDAIHPEAPENVAYDWAYGDETKVAEAFAEAARTSRLELVNNRVIATPMEPRGCFAEWDGARLHVAYGGQGVWMLRDELAANLGLDKAAVRVTTPDVGGGFGMKALNYPEYFAVAFAARALGRPVRWLASRGESMLSDNGGRDQVTTVEAAFDAGNRLLALRFDNVGNLGAYNSRWGQFQASDLPLKVLTGVYDVQPVFFRARGVYTNTTPIDSYRGAGRPEAIYVIERLMDWSARAFGVDPLELRRLNFIGTEQFPYRSASGELYDVGDFARILDRAAIEADLAGFPARRAASAADGRLRGLGLCCYIESILGDTREDARLEFAADGMVDLAVGTQSNGQGHETVYAQFLHSRAGIPFDKVRIVQGDSDRVARGGGTGGSRSVTMQGGAINKAADEAIARFRPLAEEELEVAGADLVWEDGDFRVAGTDRTIGLMALADVARARGLTDLLVTAVAYDLPGRSYPNGAHFAEVEVDPETGDTRVVKYTVVDDFGVLMNPMLAEGQVHGGVAQGIGQAITERVVFSDEGQLLSGSLMDYALPRADDVPLVAFHSEPVPSTANEIGMKGCGEAGTVGALAAVTNAALDALWPAGVRHVDMPLTPQRVWSWLQAAKADR